MSRYLMFFDDYPLASENQLFLLNLRKAFRKTDIEIDEDKTVPHLEVSLRTRAYTAIILDVMAAMPDTPDMEAVAGIEILKRCRHGTYGPLNQNAPIYMRTARGELHLREFAESIGIGGYFCPGSDDDRLINELRTLLIER